MKKLVLVLLCIGLLSSPVSLMAATEAQKQAAIDAGLAWLASQQQADGSWNYGGYEQAATGAALLAFVEQRYKPLGWNGHDYSAVVTNATNYLLGTANQVDISIANWWGFKGTANSGIGIDWLGNGETTYTSGIVLPALSRLTAGIVSPSDIISSANPAVSGLTYAQLIQRAVDIWVWGQTGPAGGPYDGGWRYVPNSNESDGSTSQWGAIAMMFAQQVPGITVPAQTKTELLNWINYIQNPGPGPLTGSAGYTAPDELNDEAKTGGLLVQMVFAGGGGSQSNALAYLNTNWQNVANNTWYGNFGHPYAMFAIYKGLELTIGLDAGTGTISNLHTNPGDINNPNHGWNWWEDYCNWLVLNQNADGSWNGYSEWIDPLSTAWDINILNGTIIAPPATAARTIVGTNGTGDTLLFPYYDVRVINVLGVNQEQDFYFAIINETINPTTFGTGTTWGGVAAKLRFREFDKSLEVYDVDIWLSCNDVWVGVVTNNNGTAHIWSPDWVIIAPDPAHACAVDDFTLDHSLDNSGAGKDFRVALQNIDPTRSLLGYFEVIGTEMTACKTHTETETSGTLVERYSLPNFLDAPNLLAGYAYAYIVRPTDGVAMGYNAINIDNFSVNSKTGNAVLANRSGCGYSLFSGAGSEKPTLLDCEDTIDQLEFEMSKFEMFGGFAIETGYVGRTSTVVTFPTKHFHFNAANQSSPFTLHLDLGTYGVGLPSFGFSAVWGDPFIGSTMNAGEPVTVRVWDRDENEFTIPGGFESPPAPQGVNVLPYEVNVIGWYTGSSTPTLVGRDNVGFPVGNNVFSGWFLLQFPSQGRDLTDGVGNTKITTFDYYGNLFQRYAGLPALGLIVQQFNNLGLTAGGAYGEILPVFSRPDWEKLVLPPS